LYPTLFLWGLVRCFRGHTPYWSFLRTLGFSHLRSIVFDQLLPRVAHYWRRNEVQTLMTMAGLHDVQLQWTNRMSWTAIGTKAGSQHPSRHRSVGDPEGWGE
jgi:hypothetical protein